MKKWKKAWRRFAALAMAILLLMPAIPVFAQGGKEDRTPVDYSNLGDWPAGPEIVGVGGFLIELNTGSILYQKNADETLYPASITKILTALVVLENCDLDEMVTFSYDAIHDLESGAYSYIADTGDQLSVRDCLYALMLMSSNECAYALAEHVGGSIDGFAEMMNEKAKALGATNSHFANPHGLYNENHYTTCHDMAMIMWGAIQNEEFLKIDSTFSYTTAPTKTQEKGYYCQMHHQMMNSTSEYFNSSVVAGKTGYIQAAKNTLVTYAVKDDMELISVVMRSEANGQVYRDTQALLDYGFDNFSMRSISATADLAAMEAQVAEVTDRVVQNFEISDHAVALLPNNQMETAFHQEFVVDSYSLNGNEMLGSLVYSWNGTELGRDSVKILLVPELTSAPEVGSTLITDFGNNNDNPAEQEKLSFVDDIPFPVLVLILVVLVVILVIVIFQMVNLIQKSRRRRRRKRNNRKRYDRY